MVITPTMPVMADFLKAAPSEPRWTEPSQPVEEAPVSRRTDEASKSDEDAPVENEKPEDKSDEDDFSDMLNQAMMATGQVQQQKTEPKPENTDKNASSQLTAVSANSTGSDQKTQTEAAAAPSLQANAQATKQTTVADAALTTITTATDAKETQSTDASVEELLKPLLNAQQSQQDESSAPVVDLKNSQLQVVKQATSNAQQDNSGLETLSQLQIQANQTTRPDTASLQADAASASASPVVTEAKPSDMLMTIQADPDDVTEEILSALQRSMEGPGLAAGSSTGSSSALSGSLTNIRSAIPGGGTELTSGVEVPFAGTSPVSGNAPNVVNNLSAAMTNGGDLTDRRGSGTGNNRAMTTMPLEAVSGPASPSSPSINSLGVASASTTTDLTSTVTAEVRQPLSAQVSRAVLEHLERGSTSETDRLTVRLDPPELGEMTIELSKTKDGLAVRVTAREAVTMDMLLSRGSEIEQQLKSQDLNLKALEFLSPGMMGQSDSSSQRRDSSEARESSMGLRSTSGRRGANGAAGSRNAVGTASPQDNSKALSFRA